MIRTLVQEALSDAQLEEGRKQAKPGTDKKAEEKEMKRKERSLVSLFSISFSPITSFPKLLFLDL